MMEKKIVRPNVRIKTSEKKNSSIKDVKTDLKEDLPFIHAHSSSYKKADNMESGFIKVVESKQTNEKTIPPTPQNEIQDTKSTTGKAISKVTQGYQITLSPSVCITAFVTLLITVAFIFLFGLIIGKGMIPVTIQEKPEKLQPQMQLSESQQTPHDVLPKEELQFMTALKVETPKESEVDTQTRTNEQNLSDAIGERHDEIIPSSRNFDFNIRVAAFRNGDQADTLREKLEGAGYRTRRIVEKDSKGKNWYFVHVLLRGSEVRLKQAQEEFKKFAIRDSIIKEQKEVK